MQTSEFIHNALKNYYDSHTVEAPPSIAQREFGAGVDKKIDWRHLSFANEQQLNVYLRSNVPFYISYSAGYYEFPDGRPMAKKNWLGADLVFDLDADEYENPCTHSKDMVCEVCMNRVKEETIKLIEDFLVPDFGFTKNDLNIVFSGNRGYHIHIRKEDVHDLSQNARKEIIDYITASGFKPDSFMRRREKHLSGPKPTEWGWPGRVTNVLTNVLSESEPKEIAKRMGVSVQTVRKILDKKELVLKGINEGDWDQVNIDPKTWKRALGLLAIEMSAEVDKGVTLDISRLMRLPNSIHGGTGFVACYISDLDGFDYSKDAIVFGGEPVNVKSLVNNELLLNDKVFELEKEKELALPEYAAFYGVAKGLVVPWE